MSTPEGKVKDHVKALLNQFCPQLYHHWPVQNGMGEPTLDCDGAINGRAFSIECKAPGKELTPRQEVTAAQKRAAGIRVFKIDGDLNKIAELRAWLTYWHTRALIEMGV